MEDTKIVDIFNKILNIMESVKLLINSENISLNENTSRLSEGKIIIDLLHMEGYEVLITLNLADLEHIEIELLNGFKYNLKINQFQFSRIILEADESNLYGFCEIMNNISDMDINEFSETLLKNFIIKGI